MPTTGKADCYMLCIHSNIFSNSLPSQVCPHFTDI